MDGVDVKAVVQNDSNGTYKYLCRTENGYVLSSMVENSVVSKAIADEARRILCRYGLSMSSSSSSSAQKLAWGASIRANTHINPSPQNTGSVGTGTVSPNLSWRLTVNPNRPYTIYRGHVNDTGFMYVENPQGLPLTYESDKPSIVSVTSAGVITINSTGSANITAKYTSTPGSMYMD